MSSLAMFVNKRVETLISSHSCLKMIGERSPCSVTAPDSACHLPSGIRFLMNSILESL